MDDQEFQRRSKEYVMGWKKTGEVLRQERLDRLRGLDTVEAVASLSGLFDSAVWLHPPSPTSGMVEMQENLRTSPLMNKVLEAARDLQEFVSARGWQYCFIGGLAVQKWSEPRVTDDVDLTLLTEETGCSGVCASCSSSAWTDAERGRSRRGVGGITI